MQTTTSFRGTSIFRSCCLYIGRNLPLAEYGAFTGPSVVTPAALVPAWALPTPSPEADSGGSDTDGAADSRAGPPFVLGSRAPRSHPLSPLAPALSLPGTGGCGSSRPVDAARALSPLGRAGVSGGGLLGTPFRPLLSLPCVPGSSAYCSCLLSLPAGPHCAVGVTSWGRNRRLVASPFVVTK